ncbi:MAG: ABC transporter ATP-binding protein [Peptococcaceae bacterium]|nr:ABC transporter ATP-binding protein [Peptococcaceae bacterium]
MACVELRNVWKVFGETVAVRDFNLRIDEGELMVVVGPSGCGKTTILRMVAGLEDVSRGGIYIGGRQVNDVLARDRNIAMVFQNYALYPHMNVFDNMAFGLKNRKVPREETRRRVGEAARVLGIDHLLGRKPKALSGGQRQRVALGRAMVREPQVFLMDEPLSNLDARLRVQMRVELARLQRRLGVTTIYVTHDQVEAMTMGHRIVIMNGGIVQQIDTPMRLYERPANLFVAGFIGSTPMNFIPVTLERHDEPALRGEGLYFPIPPELVESGLKTGKERLVLGVRPEDIGLDPELARQHPEWICRVGAEVVESLGAESLVYFTIGRTAVTARLAGVNIPRPGETVPLVFNLNRAHLFARE